MVMIAMRNDISITSILYDIRSIKDITIICGITSLRTCQSYSTIVSWSPTFTMLTMFLFLPIDFFFCTDIICMGCILKVNIVFSIYLDNITTLDFTDNILVLELVVWILHQQLFADDSIIRDLTIVIMIVIAM